MAPRHLLAAALTFGIAAACSEPSTDPRERTNRDATRQPQELALSVPANPAVASAIEVTRPGEANRTRAPRTTTAARNHTRAVMAGLATELPVVERNISLASETETTVPIVAEEPAVAPPTSGPAAAEPAVGNGDAGRRWPEPIGREPGVIIRGGRGGELDPCELHDTMRRGGRSPGPTVLVNPRFPTSGLPGAPRGGGGLPF